MRRSHLTPGPSAFRTVACDRLNAIVAETLEGLRYHARFNWHGRKGPILERRLVGHRDASIVLRVYAHWLPEPSRREMRQIEALRRAA